MTQQQDRPPAPVDQFGNPVNQFGTPLRGPGTASITPFATAPTAGTDTVAVLALVFAIVFWPAGLVLSIVGMVRTGRSGRGGRGLAIAGLVVSVVQLLLLPLLAAIAIPVFLNQRAEAVEVGLRSDLRSAAVAMESVRVDQGSYPQVLPVQDVPAPSTADQVVVVVTTPDTFCLMASSDERTLYIDHLQQVSSSGCS